MLECSVPDLKLANSPLLAVAESFLMMPDLFHWLLTGEKGNEYTDSSTTQFYNPQTKTWASDLLKRFGIPTHIFGPLLQPGTTLGPLLVTFGKSSAGKSYPTYWENGAGSRLNQTST